MRYLCLKPTIMKSSFFVFLGVALLCSACNFSKGTSKDFATGLSYSYNGFAVKQVALVGPDNAIMNTNEVVLNTQIALVVEGLTNYELKDGKAFPGMMMTVTDKAGVAVISEADLFAEGKEGYSPTDAAVLRGTITIGNPMVSGETYHAIIRIWDKVKPGHELTAEVDLTVK
jgi:hypothetical protein